MRPAILLRSALLGLLLGGPAAAMTLDGEIGARLFERVWLPAPASTAASDGLGPRFSARSCAGCHLDAGRGRAGPGSAARGLVVRFGDRSGQADPLLGRQLQPGAVAGLMPEPPPTILQAQSGGLQKPIAHVSTAPGVAAGVRIAPGLDGVGLLALVPDSWMLDRASRQHLGISGRVNRLPDGRIGRFGWKAGSADLRSQVVGALDTDLGLSTQERPGGRGDCTSEDLACQTPPAERVEAAEPIVGALVAFVSERPAPAAAKADPAGLTLFERTGCAACHQPALPLADGRVAHAFTDLLLHDLGPGLDDGVGEPGVEPSEWRTAPLWGLGAAESLGLLHDGRARSIDEAIRWHGGTAARATAHYAALPQGERAALIDFLRSL